MTSKIVVNNIESDAGVSTVFFNSDIGGTGGTLNVDGNLNVDGVLSYEDVTNIDSVGIITARNGLHVTSGNVAIGLNNPSAPLHLSGPAEIRLNNAIDAGNFARIRCFEESGDNGAHLAFNTGAGEVVRFRNDGSVGIGTENPTTNFKLDINGDLTLGESGGTDNTYIDQKQNGHLNIINSGPQSNGGKVRINKTNSISGDTTYFRDFEVYDGKNNLLLLVDGSSGNIGMGIASPTQESGRGLHIRGADGGQSRIHLTNSATGDTATDGFYIISQGAESGGASGEVMLQQKENKPLKFATNNTERLRILADGTIATGGASATPGTVAPGSIISAAANAGVFVHGYDGKFGTSSNHPLYFQTNGVTKATITAAGAFSVGTTSPQQPNLASIHVHSTANDDCRIAITTPSKPDSRIGYFGLSNKFGMDVHNGFEVRDASASYATRLTITSTGQVGLGFDSPTAPLHGRVTSGGYNAIFESTANGGESVVTIKGKKSDGTVRTAIFKYDNADMIRLGTSQSIPMRFETSDTERMKIYSDGRVIIHGNGTIRTAWSGAVCSVNNLAMMDAGSGFSWGLRANSGDTQWCLERIVGTNSFSDSNIKFRVYNNGNYTFAGSSTSDRDIKENIEDVSGTSLNLIDQLRPRTFNFKESEGYSTEPKTGFVAQEIGAVIPSIVNGTDGQKDMGVDYNGLVAHLVKAVQELKAENDSLRSRLDTAGL